MSREGRIHCAEVKRIFVVIEIMCILTLILSALLIYHQLQQHHVEFFKITSILSLLLPALCGILTFRNWDVAFDLFHKIMFHNDYWIFDEVTDPVITILPDAFFLHCAIMIFLLILLGSLLCMAFRSFFHRRFML